MAINKQSISIPLLKGINTVVDPQQDEIGSLVILRNAKFTNIGSISKRTGFQTLASHGTLSAIEDRGTNDVLSPPTVFRNVAINQALSVRSSGESPVVVSKDTIFKYSRANNILYRTGNYCPLTFSPYSIPNDHYDQFNTQTVVYGNWAYVTHSKAEHPTEPPIAFISIYDISGRIPVLVLKPSKLYLTMKGSVFPNSIDGGSTFSEFNVNEIGSVSIRMLLHNNKLYIFAVNSFYWAPGPIPVSNLFYKCCDPYALNQITNTQMSGHDASGTPYPSYAGIAVKQAPEDGGWLPVYDGGINIGTGYSGGGSWNAVYDVISHHEGIIIASVKSTGGNEVVARKYSHQPYYAYSLEHGWATRAQALGLYKLKQVNPEVSPYVEDKFPKGGDIALIQGADNTLVFTVIDEHYTNSFETIKTLNTALQSNKIKSVTLVANDSSFFNSTSSTGYDPTTPYDISGLYFSIFATYEMTLDPAVSGFYDHIMYFTNAGGVDGNGYLDSNSFGGGSSSIQVLNGDWTNVATTDLEPWSLRKTLMYQFTVADSGTGPQAHGEYLDYHYALGLSLAGRPFQIRWGDSGVAKYPNSQTPWEARSGQWIQPFSSESELQSSFLFKSLNGPYNTFDPVDSTEIDEGSSWVGQLSYGIGGGNIITDYDPGDGYGVPSFSETPYIQQGNNQTKMGVIFPHTQKYKIETEPGANLIIESASVYTSNAAKLANINFDSSIANQSREIAESLFIPGAAIGQYSGGVYNEAGWLQSPYKLYLLYEDASTNIGMEQVSTPNPTFPKGNIYHYVALYSSRDSSGRVIKSSISKQFTVTVTNTSTNTGYNNITLMIPLSQTTDRSADDVLLEVYRTTNNGTVFYKLSPPEWGIATLGKGISGNPSLAGFPAMYRVLRDFISDDSLTDNELLYTTGGILENTPPPPCSIMEVYKNILFMAGLENPNSIQYSKVVSYNTAVDFNDTLLLETPTIGGHITALKGMDNNLFIFKETSIYFIAGGQNNFTSYLKTRSGQSAEIELAILSSDIGCVNKNSCILTPVGIIFKSNRGIYLVSRGLQLEYVGAPIQSYNNLVIKDSCLLAKEGEVRFITEGADCLVYNFERNVWYTFSQHTGPSNTVIDDEYYFIDGSDQLKIESDGFNDGGTPIPLEFETGWMSFAEVQGFQRVYRMLILGKYKSAHQIRVKVAYDFKDAWVDEQIITITDSSEPSTTIPQEDRFEDYNYGGPNKQKIGLRPGSDNLIAQFVEPGVISDGQYGDPSGNFKTIPEGEFGVGFPAELSDSNSVDSSTLINTADYPDDLVGASLGYSVNEGLQYQFRVNFKKQKCESIKISIETIQDTDQTYEGSTFSNLSFLVGIKGGDYKIKQSRVKGTT